LTASAQDLRFAVCLWERTKVLERIYTRHCALTVCHCDIVGSQLLRMMMSLLQIMIGETCGVWKNENGRNRYKLQSVPQ